MKLVIVIRLYVLFVRNGHKKISDNVGNGRKVQSNPAAEQETVCPQSVS